MKADAEAGAGAAGGPGTVQTLYFPAVPHPPRASPGRGGAKHQARGAGSPRRRGCGCGRGHQRWLCSSILLACRGHLTCSPAGCPRPPAQRRRSCRQAARVQRWGGGESAPLTPHQDPPTAPRSPPTHLGAELGVGAVVPQASGVLRGEEPLLHADGAGEALHLPAARRREGPGLSRASVSPGGFGTAAPPGGGGGGLELSCLPGGEPRRGPAPHLPGTGGGSSCSPRTPPAAASAARRPGSGRGAPPGPPPPALGPRTPAEGWG